MSLFGPERPDAYHFQPTDIWKGLEVGGETVCNGLIRDWVSWQREHLISPEEGDASSLLTQALNERGS